jgi:hypothetical protein
MKYLFLKLTLNNLYASLKKVNDMYKKIVTKSIAVILVSIIIGCTENSVESQPQGLTGSWEWVQSSGGFAGWTLSPDSVGFNLYYEFRSDSTVSQWQNDSLIFESKFSVYQNTLTIEGRDIGFTWQITGDSLILRDQCIDCFVHIYKRGDRSKPQILIRNDLKSVEANGPLAIQNVQISGDDLSITVSYSGGCKDHSFILFVSSAFMKSKPVQAELFLSHEDHDDPCDAIITETIYFDLTRLKHIYQERYGMSGSMYLKIRGDGNDSHYVPLPLYEF